MPKVSIREIDNTGAETLEYLDYTVLIPAPHLEYKVVVGYDENKDPIEETRELRGLYTKKSQITGLKFELPKVNNKEYPYEQDLGYLMAVELLSKGLTVYYAPTYALSGRSVGTEIVWERQLCDFFEDGVAEISEDVNVYLKKFFHEFSDKGKYDLRFITLGGLDNDLGETVFDDASKEALICAGDRGDAVAILNVPEKCNTAPIDEFYLGYYKDEEQPSESGGAPVTVRTWSATPLTGYTKTYLTSTEYDALADAVKEILKNNNYNGFEIYIKYTSNSVPEDYSKLPAKGYDKVVWTLDQYKLIESNTEIAPKCTEVKNNPSDLNNSTAIDNWVNDTFGTLAETTIERSGVSWNTQESSTETYGRYGAIFAPVTTIKFNAGRLKVPAGFGYLACFAKYVTNFKPWFAMSGSVRGVSPYSGIEPSVLFGDADINNILQIRTCDIKDEGHLATNVICEIRPYGNIIWGNRTMHPLKRPDNADATSAVQLTASSFLNIRQLCCSIKKTLYRAARRFTFEPNSDTLWYNFKGAITPLLEEMKANQGIKGYQVIKVKTNKKALLVARIKITPIEAVEDFDLTVELTDSIEVTE